MLEPPERQPLLLGRHRLRERAVERVLERGRLQAHERMLGARERDDVGAQRHLVEADHTLPDGVAGLGVGEVAVERAPHDGGRACEWMVGHRRIVEPRAPVAWRQ